MDMLSGQSLAKEDIYDMASQQARSALRLFVGGIPKHLKEHHLRRYFSQFGCTGVSRITRSGTDKSRGYCYLEFEHKQGFESVLSGPESKVTIEGSLLKVESAIDPGFRKKLQKSLSERRLYLNGISCYVTIEDLISSVSMFGTVQNITKLRRSHPFTTPPSFYCYVTMDRQSDAQRMLERGIILQSGERITVKHFLSHSERSAMKRSDKSQASCGTQQGDKEVN